MIYPQILRQDQKRIAFLPFRVTLNDIEHDPRFGQQFDPTKVHLVAGRFEIAPACQQGRLRYGDRLLQVRFKPFDMTVSLSDNVIHRRIELSIGMHLIANVAPSALGYIRGDIRVKLGLQFQPAEVRPEIFEADGQIGDTAKKKIDESLCRSLFVV